MNFDDLGLSPHLVRALVECAYTQATPIQAQAIPWVLDGRDVLAAAQTGTGKTAAFMLPVLQRLAFVGAARPKQLRSLVLTSARELALQIHDSALAYGQHLELRSAVLVDGVDAEPQIAALAGGVDILVATPGRLLDLVQRGAMDFSALEILVLDEADRMLHMALIRDTQRIVDMLPRNRQTLMFATAFSKQIQSLAAQYLHDPVSVPVAAADSSTELVEQAVYAVEQSRKSDSRVHLLN